MNIEFGNEIRLKLVKLLQEKLQITQREMNQKMGIRLGKINYCISALSQKGLIRVQRFKKSKNKSVYIYRLTPSGVEELTVLTLGRIKVEITSLSGQIKAIDPVFYDDEVLKNID